MSSNSTLDRVCRLLGTVRGTDKVMMFVQYFSKILVFANTRRGGKDFAETNARINALAGPVADFRILLRYYGMLPLVQWVLHTEQHPSKNKTIRLLTRLENAANLCYYPLEHAYWLGAHGVVDMAPETRDRIGMWSCRFWAAYVGLYFWHLWEEWKELELEEKKGGEKKAIADKKRSLALEAVVNAAYAPLTVHWSLPASSFPDIGVGICGTVAAVAQLVSAWRGTV